MIRIVCSVLHLSVRSLLCHLLTNFLAPLRFLYSKLSCIAGLVQFMLNQHSLSNNLLPPPSETESDSKSLPATAPNDVTKTANSSSHWERSADAASPPSAQAPPASPPPVEMNNVPPLSKANLCAWHKQNPRSALLQRAPSINHTDIHGENPLFDASRQGHWDIVSMLIGTFMCSLHLQSLLTKFFENVAGLVLC